MQQSIVDFHKFIYIPSKLTIDEDLYSGDYFRPYKKLIAKAIKLTNNQERAHRKVSSAMQAMQFFINTKVSHKVQLKNMSID